MAKRPSVQEILELARRGGPAKPGSGSPPAAEPQAEAPETPAEPVAAADVSAPEPAADVPTPQTPGRPLTLQEKLAAARAGGAPKAAAPAAPKAAAPGPASEDVEAPAETPAARAVPPPAAPAGRPLTLAEKLAAARTGGASPAPAPGGAAKPAAKAAPAAAAAKPAAARRELPPLDKITDPKDLAEALRQTGARKAKEVEAAKAKDAPVAKPAREKEAKPSTVLPRPAKDVVLGAAAVPRRAFLSLTALIWIGWGAFILGVLQFTAMLGRFMFPNVLAEPPSTIKVGPPTNYEPDAVNERFKAEWGFWIVRSTRYNGTDIIYALQSVCTHLGCPPNWLAGEQKFKCPCHGSGFYISGVNFEGPAPRPLERFKVSQSDDGQLVIDKSQKFQEELGQWSDPDSYVVA